MENRYAVAGGPHLTRHRRAVLEVVRARPAHPTVAEVYDAVRRVDPGIAHATVYNALHYLVDAGLLVEVRHPDGGARYDRETRPHEHALCRVCGDVADVRRTPAVTLAAAAYAEVATQTGYTIERHDIAFQGLCPRCQTERPAR